MCDPEVDIFLKGGVLQRQVVGSEVGEHRREKVYAGLTQSEVNGQRFAFAREVVAIGAVDCLACTLHRMCTAVILLGENQTDSRCVRMAPYDERRLEVREGKPRGRGNGGFQGIEILLGML